MTDNRLLYQTAFKKKLEQVGVPFRLEKSNLYFNWTGINCCLNYQPDNSLQLYGLKLSQIDAGKLARAYVLCNRLNNETKWLKFVVTKNNELACMVTSAINADDVVEECMELLERMQQAVLSLKQQLALM